MSVATATRMTTEELLALPDDGMERWLIRGELREKIAEQARSLGRGRRGDGDRALLGEG